MNRKRVIILMTMAVFAIIGWLMVAIFDGFPPWPVVACFTLSHVFFCLIVSRTRPYRGPYTTPLTGRTAKDWD